MYLTKLASIHLVNWNMLEKYNQDPHEVFKKAHLDPSLMYQRGARYPLDKVAVLWTEMAKVIKDPCFGLSAATSWHPSNFGTLGYALLMSTSLRTTLERLIRFHRVISDARFGELRENSSDETLQFTLTNFDEKHYSAAREDAALAWILSVLRVNFQRSLSPVSISVTHGTPSCSGKYYEFFQSPVNFNSQNGGITLSVKDADKILPSGDKDMVEFKEQAMAQYLSAKESDSLIPRVTKLIVEHLPSGNATIENIASDLFVSTRKLQRQLQEKGTSFLSLLKETRKNIAIEYIRDKDMDLTEIAFLLGYAEQSTFSRSFKKWTGKPPSKFRKVA